MISDRRLYLDASRSIVVEEGDARASFLLVGKGCEIDDAEAKRYGLGKVGENAHLPPEYRETLEATLNEPHINPFSQPPKKPKRHPKG